MHFPCPGSQSQAGTAGVATAIAASPSPYSSARGVGPMVGTTARCLSAPEPL